MTLPFDPQAIDAILFDMDGTLIETDDQEVLKWEARISRLYRQSDKAAQDARRIVMGLETPANAVFTVLDLFGLDRLAYNLMSGPRRDHHGEEEIPPVDGVPELIEQLAERYKLGVVSTRLVSESDAHLQKMGVRQHFDVIAGRDSTWHIKPRPQPIQYAAHLLGVDPSRCLMVGDTTVDVRAGLRAGSWTIAVLCGFGERPELERVGAHLILDHTSALGELL